MDARASKSLFTNYSSAIFTMEHVWLRIYRATIQCNCKCMYVCLSLNAFNEFNLTDS